MEWSTQEMDSQSPKLSLDLSPPWIHPPPPHSVKATRRIDESSSELRDYISALEDELRKIEVFKRELPLSHVILNDAIAKLKKDESNGRSRKSATAISAHNDHKASEINLEKSDLDEDQADKRSWLRSVQLWSSYSSDQSSPLLRPKLSLLDRREVKTDDQAIECRNNDQGESVKRSSLTSNGTSLPSRKGEFASTTATNSNIRNAHHGDELGVVTSSSIQGSPTNEAILKSEVCGRVRRISSEGYAHPLRKSPPPRHLQHREALQAARRKQRRCWSPDLHRRFVDALEKLGGSQVATPKQIREVMQVDGLTNDEVKSHLQKYRLHIRKLPSTCSSMSTSTDEQLFLEDDSDRIKVKGSKSATGNESGSPEGPLHMSVFRSAKSNSGASRCDDNTLEEEMRDAGRGEYEDEDETSDGSHSLDWKGCSSLNLK